MVIKEEKMRFIYYYTGPGSIGALIAGIGVVIMILFPLDRPRVNKKEKKDQ